MPSSLEGHGVVITGATGIAAAGARRFADDGAAVFVVSLDEGECRVLADEVGCGWAAADLRDESATEDAFAAARDHLGRVDGLFAVAGASGRRHGDGPVHEIPLEGWEATFALNGHPAFLALREAVRAMRSQDRDATGGRGSIVLVSSVLAQHPSPDLFATHAYAASKGAAIALARTAASYYARDGIRVNTVLPGLVATPMAARAADDPTTVAYAEAKQPLIGGFLAPEDVAAAAAYLLSPDARAVTGQALAVDGGWGVTEVRDG